jgi:hypothetical protein
MQPPPAAKNKSRAPLFAVCRLPNGRRSTTAKVPYNGRHNAQRETDFTRFSSLGSGGKRGKGALALGHNVNFAYLNGARLYLSSNVVYGPREN